MLEAFFLWLKIQVQMKNFFLIYILLLPISLLAQEEQNEVKRTFYNDSILAVERWYGDDEKLDSLKTFYKSGELNELFYYEKGYYQRKSYSVNRLGEKSNTWDFNKGKSIKKSYHILSSYKTEEK